MPENLKSVGQVATEAIEEVRAKQAKWQSDHTIGEVNYDPDSNTFGVAASAYWWPRNECLTATGLITWVAHLRRKPWFTSQMLFDFLDCLEMTIQETEGNDLQFHFEHGPREQRRSNGLEDPERPFRG